MELGTERWGRGMNKTGSCLPGALSLRGPGSFTDTSKQRSLFKRGTGPTLYEGDRKDRREVGMGRGQGVEVRSGDGFIRNGFLEEAGLKLGPEKLKQDLGGMPSARDSSG